MTNEKTIGTWRSMFDRKYERVDAPVSTCKKCGGNLDQIGSGKWRCKSCNIEYTYQAYGATTIAESPMDLDRLANLMYSMIGKDRFSKSQKDEIRSLIDAYSDVKKIIHSSHFETWNSKGTGFSRHDDSNTSTDYIMQNISRFGTPSYYAQVILGFLSDLCYKVDHFYEVSINTKDNKVFIQGYVFALYNRKSSGLKEVEIEGYKKEPFSTKDINAILKYIDELDGRFKLSWMDDEIVKINASEKSKKQILTFIRKFQ